jgi:hypothetical protein
MTTRAVLFDLGNTLVHYYRAPEFRPVLRQCLERTAIALGRAVSDDLYEQALLLNCEDPRLPVRPPIRSDSLPLPARGRRRRTPRV